jgi:uncharacterized protein (DUF2336 family)
MVAFQDFVALCDSPDSEARGMAAHLAAQAFLSHSGPADEQAALYAALIGFLDDPSVKVRAALAYGLLHAREAPRPILLALLQDAPVIARAVAQYSPALVDADLLGLIRQGIPEVLMAVAERETLSTRLVSALLATGNRMATLKLLGRHGLAFPDDALPELAAGAGQSDARLRGALLGRPDLPAPARLLLVEAAAAALGRARMVAGAVQPARLARLLRHATDTALTSIGEAEAADDSARGETAYAAGMVAAERVSPRLMIHAIVNGRVLFFADCIAALSEAPRRKVFSILEHGGRAALSALLQRCGFSPALRTLLGRLVLHARSADLADDVAARHYVVTALTEELLAEFDGVVPAELEDAFAYLGEQNVALARAAARGVMTAFAAGSGMQSLPGAEPRLALTAA